MTLLEETLGKLRLHKAIPEPTLVSRSETRTQRKQDDKSLKDQHIKMKYLETNRKNLIS
jgi:hypothetical protein